MCHGCLAHSLRPVTGHSHGGKRRGHEERSCSTWPSERSLLRKARHPGSRLLLWCGALLHPAGAPAPGEEGEGGQAPHGVTLQGQVPSIQSVPFCNLRTDRSEPEARAVGAQAFSGRRKECGSGVRPGRRPPPTQVSHRVPGMLGVGPPCSWGLDVLWQFSFLELRVCLWLGHISGNRIPGQGM